MTITIVFQHLSTTTTITSTIVIVAYVETNDDVFLKFVLIVYNFTDLKKNVQKF